MPGADRRRLEQLDLGEFAFRLRDNTVYNQMSAFAYIKFWRRGNQQNKISAKGSGMTRSQEHNAVSSANFFGLDCGNPETYKHASAHRPPMYQTQTQAPTPSFRVTKNGHLEL